jgi:hypothetical protein
MNAYTSGARPPGETRGVPDGWYYSETETDRVWSELEEPIGAQLAADAEDLPKGERNPFQEIDQSTHRIRTLIDSFQLSDQEFLMELMAMLDDETTIDNIDQQSVLMQARFRLAEMIEDHVSSSDAQVKLLDSLKHWFNAIQRQSQEEIANKLPQFSDGETIDAFQLATMINEICEKNEIRSESMSQLHRSITTELQRRVRDSELKVKSQEAEIDRLNQQIEVQQHTKRRAQVGRSRAQASARDTAVDLTAAQRRIAEQEASISSLKHALTATRNEVEEAASESSRAGAAQRSVPEGATLASGRDADYQAQMQFFSDQIAQLKLECNTYQQQLKASKMTEISLTSKVGSLERYKKNLEDSLEAHRQRYEIMESTYQKKIDALAQKPVIPEAASAANQTLQADFQAELAKVREQARAQQQMAIEQVEKRNRAQIADLLKSLEANESKAIMDEMVKQHQLKTEEMTKMYQRQIEELRAIHTDKLNATIKQYEAKLKNAGLAQDQVKMAFDEDLQAKLLQQKLELEDSFRRMLAAAQDEASGNYADMYHKLTFKNETLLNAFKKLQAERNALRDIADEVEAARIPRAEGSDVEDEEFIDMQRDGELMDELAVQAKITEATRAVESKYQAMLNSQKEVLTNEKQWELQKQKEDFERELEKQMNHYRTAMTEELDKLRQKLQQTENATDMTTAINELTMRSLHEEERTRDNFVSHEKMIPLSEVEEKMGRMGTQITNLKSENELLRKSLAKMSQTKDLQTDKGEDLVAVMQGAINDEREKMIIILKENEHYVERIQGLEKDLDDRDLLIARLQEQIEELKSKPPEIVENRVEVEVPVYIDREMPVSMPTMPDIPGAVSTPVKPSPRPATADAPPKHSAVGPPPESVQKPKTPPTSPSVSEPVFAEAPKSKQDIPTATPVEEPVKATEAVKPASEGSEPSRTVPSAFRPKDESSDEQPPKPSPSPPPASPPKPQTPIDPILIQAGMSAISCPCCHNKLPISVIDVRDQIDFSLFEHSEDSANLEHLRQELAELRKTHEQLIGAAERQPVPEPTPSPQEGKVQVKMDRDLDSKKELQEVESRIETRMQQGNALAAAKKAACQFRDIEIQAALISEQPTPPPGAPVVKDEPSPTRRFSMIGPSVVVVGGNEPLLPDPDKYPTLESQTDQPAERPVGSQTQSPVHSARPASSGAQSGRTDRAQTPGTPTHAPGPTVNVQVQLPSGDVVLVPVQMPPGGVLQGPAEVVQAPGQAAQVPEQGVQLTAQAIQAPGQVAQAPGRVIQGSGHVVQVPGQVIQAPSQIIQGPVQIIQAPGQVVQVGGHVVQVPMQMPSGEVVQVPAQIVGQSPGQVQLVLLPRQMRQRSGQVTQVPMQLAPGTGQGITEGEALVQMVQVVQQPVDGTVQIIQVPGQASGREAPDPVQVTWIPAPVPQVLAQPQAGGLAAHVGQASLGVPVQVVQVPMQIAQQPGEAPAQLVQAVQQPGETGQVQLVQAPFQMPGDSGQGPIQSVEVPSQGQQQVAPNQIDQLQTPTHLPVQIVRGEQEHVQIGQVPGPIAEGTGLEQPPEAPQVVQVPSPIPMQVVQPPSEAPQFIQVVQPPRQVFQVPPQMVQVAGPVAGISCSGPARSLPRLFTSQCSLSSSQDRAAQSSSSRCRCKSSSGRGKVAKSNLSRPHSKNLRRLFPAVISLKSQSRSRSRLSKCPGKLSVPMHNLSLSTTPYHRPQNSLSRQL